MVKSSSYFHFCHRDYGWRKNVESFGPNVKERITNLRTLEIFLWVFLFVPVPRFLDLTSGEEWEGLLPLTRLIINVTHTTYTRLSPSEYHDTVTSLLCELYRVYSLSLPSLLQNLVSWFFSTRCTRKKFFLSSSRVCLLNPPFEAVYFCLTCSRLSELSYD